MELEKQLSSLCDITEQIQDLQVKNAFIVLLNIVEELYAENKTLKMENQALKDEINRLKGEQGKPTIKPNRKKSRDISSEKERKRRKRWKKKAKKLNIPIDDTVACKMNKEDLPSDAVFKYRDEVIGQDVIFHRKNTLYLVDVYYSPSEKKTYRAALPDEYNGYHGTGIQSFALTLHNVCDVTSNKILSLLHCIGIEISKGSLSNLLLGNTPWLFEEKNAILHAGLDVSYAQVDATSSRVCGQNYHTQIICNDFFTFYTTLKNKSRLDVLAAFQGLHDKNQLQVLYNEETIQLFKTFKVPHNDTVLLAEMFQKGFQESLADFEMRIQNQLPTLYNKPNIFHRVKEAFVFAAYHDQKEYPLVELLVSDDASEYNKIAILFHGLCWIHDARYYKKLAPVIKAHQEIVSDFMDQYWQYYKNLLEYKKNPSKKSAKMLQQKFDQLFGSNTNYSQLNTCIKRTRENKNQLLGVLEYPQIPLHNNLSELGARRKVRKRDISLHTMTKKGTMVQDAWMTIVQTATQLGVDIYKYIFSKMSKSEKTISLADIIYQKATCNTT
ncbi:MAG: transposase [Chitinispirillia bacterium]|jgi:cell division protein FtsB